MEDRLPAGPDKTSQGAGVAVGKKRTTSTSQATSPGPKDGKKPAGSAARGPRWPVFRFIATFAILMALFYGVFYLPPHQSNWMTGIGAWLAGVFGEGNWISSGIEGFAERLASFSAWYLSKYASVSGAVLDILGEEITVRGQHISSPRFAVSIVSGCDAMEATALFVSAAIALPVPIRRRLVGVVGGVVSLCLVNLFRIVSLYYVGVFKHAWFKTAHIDIWQPAFILIAIVFWIAWAWWATKPPAASFDQDEATGTDSTAT